MPNVKLSYKNLKKDDNGQLFPFNEEQFVC